MKKSLFILSLFLFTLPAVAQGLKAGVEKNNYFDYLEQVGLSEEQKQKIQIIRQEEETILRPIVLDMTSKEEGLIFLDNLKCDMFDKKCKTKLKENKLYLEFEKEELQRQIRQKQTYYKIRYKNVLTREQNYKIQQIAEFEAKKEKVLKEREQRAKKQERVQKIKNIFKG